MTKTVHRKEGGWAVILFRMVRVLGWSSFIERSIGQFSLGFSSRKSKSKQTDFDQFLGAKPARTIKDKSNQPNSIQLDWLGFYSFLSFNLHPIYVQYICN